MGQKTTMIATGDAFITRRLPEGGYEGFEELSRLIKRHQVRFSNLEITIHDHEGYPSAFSGGTWAMAQPDILDDLNLYGFNIYNTANNHSLDYSHGGLLATIDNLKKRGLPFAGTGHNLASASASAYVETDCARVSLIAACSSFHESGAAGNQRLDMQGRPGLNPLRFKTTYHVQKDYFDTLQTVADLTKMNAEQVKAIKNGYAPPLPEGRLNFGGLSFLCDTVNELRTDPLQKDMDRIAANIAEARRQSDYVLVSIHAHESLHGDSARPAEFLETFSRACIDAGAHAVLGHGPHELRGIELYRGGVIFYSLGNFIFQTETVALQPADAYENHGMPNTTMVGEYMDNRSQNGTRGYGVQPNIWRAVAAGLTAENGRITQVQLYPITLDMALPRGLKGWPRLSYANDTLAYLAELSAPYGTQLRIADGMATIDLF
jgi:poly-gamma-glutamate synthesis protein (capsule biosynthesis protein)